MGPLRLTYMYMYVRENTVLIVEMSSVTCSDQALGHKPRFTYMYARENTVLIVEMSSVTCSD